MGTIVGFVRRWWITFVGLAAYALYIGVLLLAAPTLMATTASASPAPSPTNASSPVPSPSATASVSASPSPKPTLVALADDADALSGAVMKLGVALVTLLVLLPLAIVLALRAVALVWRLVHRRQLVIEDIADGTGDDALKAALPALSQRFREDVLRATRAIEAQVRVDLGARGLVSDPPPQSVALAGLIELNTALKDASPAQVQLVLALFAALFPAAGRRVSCTVQLVGAPPWRLGLSVHVADLAQRSRGHLDSLWAVRPATTLPAGALPLPQDPSTARPLTEVALQLEQAGRWADARAKYEAAVTADPGFGPGVDGLTRILARPVIRARGEEFLEPAARWLAIWLVGLAWLEQLDA